MQKKNWLRAGVSFFLVGAACCARLYGVFPFGAAVLIGCLACGAPLWAVFPAAFVGIAVDYSVEHLIEVVVTVVIGSLAAVRVLQSKKFLFPLYLLASCGKIYGLCFGAEPWKAAFAVLLGAAGLAATLAALKDGDLRTCGLGALALIVGMGCHAQPHVAALIIGAFSICVIRAQVRSGAALIALYGAGGFAVTGDARWAAFYCLAAGIGILVARNKWITLVSMVAASALMPLIAGTSVWVTVAYIGGCVIGVPIPVKRRVKSSNAYAILPVLRKMKVAAEACRHVDVGLTESETDAAELGTVLCARVCDGCKQYSVCGVEGQAFEKVASRALQKGRVSIDILTDELLERCARAHEVTRTLVPLFKDYECNIALNGMRRAASGLVAQEFAAFADLITAWVSEAGGETYADAEFTRDVGAALEEGGAKLHSLAISGEGLQVIVGKAQDEEVLASVNKGRRRYEIDCVTQMDGVTEYYLMPKPRLSVYFGAAQTAKEGESGDAYFVKKMNASTAIAVVCDGMGSGAAARQISERTIGLMEAFFAAGFRSEYVLRFVNALFSLTGDRLSCVDLCVIDLNRGKATFVKVGGVESYVVREDGCEKIEGGSLPLGAAEAVKPVVTEADIQSGDLIVLTTDGITDTGEPFLTRASNPQALADRLLQTAVEADGGKPHDDMTALVLRAV